MQVYPAIDIKGGRVVRVLEGESVRETDYTDNPLAQAEAFVAQGAQWLHVVDMDRAFATGGDNIGWVERIAAIAGVAVQVGGDIGTVEWAQAAASAGAARLVLGTAAGLDPRRFAALVRAVGPERCALAVDTRDERLALRKGTPPAGATIVDLVRRALDSAVATIVYRDLARDGCLTGADVCGASEVKALGADVIVAGGVAGLEDLRAAAAVGLAGVIVGRALYEGRFSLREAIECSQ